MCRAEKRRATAADARPGTAPTIQVSGSERAADAVAAPGSSMGSSSARAGAAASAQKRTRSRAARVTGRATRRRAERSGVRPAYTRRVNAFTVVCGGLLAFFVVGTLLLGLFSKRSAHEILDWKPTRSAELEAENEVDDVAQMIEAQNALRRRLGKPERTQEEVELDLMRDQAYLREYRDRAWRES